MIQHDFLGQQRIVLCIFLLIEVVQLGNIDPWHDAVGLYLIGIEHVESARGAHEDAPVAGLHHGTGLCLFANEAVVASKALQSTALGQRLITHDATVGGEPQHTVVLHNTHDVLRRHIEAYLLEMAFRHICKVAES